MGEGLRGMRTTVDVRWSAGPSGWMDQAACREYPYFWWEAETGPEARMAKRICWEQCPVRRECLQAAMLAERGEKDWFRQGIWGGLSAYHRRLIARGDAPYPESMPTDARYERMRGRGRKVKGEVDA